jgi:hypothetical protein
MDHLLTIYAARGCRDYDSEMNSEWKYRMGAVRAWMYVVALAAIGIVWLVRR